eukprot:scaffold13527_cov202-Amphora_coffeaeformis.AAC.14
MNCRRFRDDSVQIRRFSVSGMELVYLEDGGATLSFYSLVAVSKYGGITLGDRVTDASIQV